MNAMTGEATPLVPRHPLEVDSAPAQPPGGALGRLVRLACAAVLVLTLAAVGLLHTTARPADPGPPAAEHAAPAPAPPL